MQASPPSHAFCPHPHISTSSLSDGSPNGAEATCLPVARFFHSKTHSGTCAVAARSIGRCSVLHLPSHHAALFPPILCCLYRRQKSPLLTSAGRAVRCRNIIFTNSKSDKFPLGCTKAVNVSTLDLEWAWIVMRFVVILHLKTISVWLKHRGCFSKTHFEFCPNRMFAH